MPLIARYCSQCGTPVTRRRVEGKTREICPACKTVFYRNPLPVAAVLILNPAREVLLVKRRNPPKKGLWCLPMGFAELDETIAQAALRELHEETGVSGKIVRLLAAGSAVIDPYGDLLIVTFEAAKTTGRETPGDDAEKVAYFPLNALPDMAFDVNVSAIRYCIEAHQDCWSIEDSYRHTLARTTDEKLSDSLVGRIQNHTETISARWLRAVRTNPTTATYAAVDSGHLRIRVRQALTQLSGWLSENKTNKEIFDFYINLGRERKKMGFGPYETIGSLTILRRIIQSFAAKQLARNNAVNAYKILELDHRIISFFDRAVYYTSRGFEED